MPMTPERWLQIRKVLQEALEHEPDKQAAFIAGACAGDDELHREVESLLAANENADGFLQSSVLELLEDGRNPIEVGTRLGTYTILSPLGAGGMGEVYRALDSKLGRDVAIKLLPQDFSNDAERLARFNREARMLAALNHPNIAAIYGLEETTDTTFLVLELIEGQTLSGPLPLAQALQYAQQI